MDIMLVYNPYFLRATFFKKKNKQWVPYPSRTDWVEKFQHTQLQSWFQKGVNNAGFFSELEKALNDSEITIYFEGRELDYVDLYAECENYKIVGSSSTIFSVKKPQLFSLTDQEMLNRLASIRDTMTSASFKNEEPVKRALVAYDHWMDSRFDLAVVATMSSGKSTLINALVGQPLLPMGNKATTAKSTEILDEDGARAFTYVAYKKGGGLLNKTPELATLPIMKALNANNDIARVQITGDIPEISSKNLHLNLIDTPGPDNSDCLDHRMVTMSKISDNDKKPLILYVMNLTQLQTDSEDAFLDAIKKAMEDSPQAKERMIFVLNRADGIENSEYGAQEDILTFVAEAKTYLERKYGIKSPKIIPVSAQTAYLQGIDNLGKLDEEGQDALQHLRKRMENPARNLVQSATLSVTCRNQLETALHIAQEQQDIPTLTMISSGLYGLRLTINEYLEKYAMPFKINMCVDAIYRELRELEANFKHRLTMATNSEALKQARDTLKDRERVMHQTQKRTTALKSQIKAAGSLVEVEKITRGNIVDINVILMQEIDKITKHEKEIPQAEGMLICKSFRDKMALEVKKMKKILEQELDDEQKKNFSAMYQEAEGIMTDFKEYLTGLGYRADRNNQLYQLKNVLKQQGNFSVGQALEGKSIPTFEKMKKVSVEIDNPEREGFFGFFKFWEPATITVQREKSFGAHIRIDQITARLSLELEKISQQCDPIIMGMKELYDSRKVAMEDLVTEMETIIRRIDAERTSCIEQVQCGEYNIKQLESQCEEVGIVRHRCNQLHD